MKILFLAFLGCQQDEPSDKVTENLPENRHSVG